MGNEIDFTRLKTSWTKFDIVQALDVIYNVETINKFKNKEIDIDGPILRSFLGVKNLDESIPEYWIEIQKYPKEKKIFSLLALIFTHGGIVKEFAEKYAFNNMTGIFKKEPGKQYTNIRSALVEAGAAQPIYRRSDIVPYDISIVFNNPAIGKLFKQVLLERFSRLKNSDLSEDEFYEACFFNNFHKALGITKIKLKDWLSGKSLVFGYIQKIHIKDFYSIKDIEMDFGASKEVYFLGENGDGKTLLLMALYLSTNGNYIFTKTDRGHTGKVSEIFRKDPGIFLEAIDSSDKKYNLSSPNYIENFFAYGTHRGRYSTDSFEQYGFMSLFDSDQTLKNPISWLKDQKLIELESQKQETKTSPIIPTEELEHIFFELLEKNVEIKIQDAEVSFIEKGYKLTFDQLSEGYRSIIIFVTDLLYRLSQKISDINSSSKLRSIRGIVLVDEIDLHLHPKWQRTIVKKLRNLFPHIQFFFTTHSPTIIQGASEDAIIYRIYKENAITRASDLYYRKELNHLMINTLVTSPLFGLENSRLDPQSTFSNTDDSYLLYKINRQLEILLNEQKSAGKNFISEDDINTLITNIIDQEMNND